MSNDANDCEVDDDDDNRNDDDDNYCCNHRRNQCDTARYCYVVCRDIKISNDACRDMQHRRQTQCICTVWVEVVRNEHTHPQI